MFFRNVWTAAELSNSCKPLLFKQAREPITKGQYQLRNSLHNARRGPRRAQLEPDPLEAFHIESGPLYAKKLVRPLFFAVGVSAVSLAGCGIWEYENLRAHAYTLFKRPGTWLGAQQKKIMTYKNEPGTLKKWWNSLNNSEKVFYPILAANVMVFGAWRVKAWQPFMIKYFCSNPSGNSKLVPIFPVIIWMLISNSVSTHTDFRAYQHRHLTSGALCLPMLLSTFSHHSPLHLAANMYVLYSFMPAAVASLGKEQFTALYLSSGVISSFASFLYKVMVNQPGLSLGASGAIMSVLSYVCVQYPDTRLSIIFLPMYTFAAGTAIKAIMGMDLAGIVFGWKFFDHAAHLGGALFGIAWCHWGTAHIWGNRDKFLQYYHHMRKTDTGR